MSEHNWNLSVLSTGERCALKRAAGSNEKNLPALRAFYMAGGRFEESEYPAMCMECLWRETDTSEVHSMEECLKMYLASESTNVTESMKHRIDSVLETANGKDGFLIGKLMNLVRILKSQTNLKPDFKKLSDDLYRWNDSTKKVQRRWIRTVYGLYNPGNNEDNEENEEIKTEQE